jgi:hypothetical protein
VQWRYAPSGFDACTGVPVADSEHASVFTVPNATAGLIGDTYWRRRYVGYAPDGTFSLPDGAVPPPDGAVLPPDGAFLPPGAASSPPQPSARRGGGTIKFGFHPIEHGLDRIQCQNPLIMIGISGDCEENCSTSTGSDFEVRTAIFEAVTMRVT